MMKTKKVTVELSLNDANSLIAYLGLFRVAMEDKSSDLYRAFDQNLTAADWQGAARCLEPLRRAVKHG
ncbi:MAG: hypothetical protein O2968_18285 [Acidobacteria bacterium]|nr:hypothetical protein [Acidobacteriota bacterium]